MAISHTYNTHDRSELSTSTVATVLDPNVDADLRRERRLNHDVERGIAVGALNLGSNLALVADRRLDGVKISFELLAATGTCQFTSFVQRHMSQKTTGVRKWFGSSTRLARVCRYPFS